MWIAHGGSVFFAARDGMRVKTRFWQIGRAKSRRRLG
jgi:hypothetical protein